MKKILLILAVCLLTYSCRRCGTCDGVDYKGDNYKKEFCGHEYREVKKEAKEQKDAGTPWKAKFSNCKDNL